MMVFNDAVIGTTEYIAYYVTKINEAWNAKDV